MTAESPIQRQIWAKLGSRGDTVLFRLNSGQAWMSGMGPRGVERLQDGSVLIRAGRPVALGFAYPNGKTVTGQLDLGGWTEVMVTSEMVGHKIAVVAFVDAKRSDGGRTSKEQANFVQQVTAAGGIAGIANSAEAAQAIFDNWHHRF